MARLEDIPLGERKMMLELDCSGLEGRRPWTRPRPPGERRIAIVSTAGLNVRSDTAFDRGEPSYRVIPGDADPADLVMTHTSVNFDRVGFQQDVNVCFPIERLHELAEQGTIGSVAKYHYTVIGGIHPRDLEPAVRDIARHMKADEVDTVLLVPI